MTATAYVIPAHRRDIFDWKADVEELDLRNRSFPATAPVGFTLGASTPALPVAQWPEDRCEKWDRCDRTPGHDAPCRGFLGRNPEEYE